MHMNIRDAIGQALSDVLTTDFMADSPGEDPRLATDWFDARNVDVLADAVMKRLRLDNDWKLVPVQPTGHMLNCMGFHTFSPDLVWRVALQEVPELPDAE